jgi:hypothetical protein
VILFILPPIKEASSSERKTCPVFDGIPKLRRSYIKDPLITLAFSCKFKKSNPEPDVPRRVGEHGAFGLQEWSAKERGSIKSCSFSLADHRLVPVVRCALPAEAMTASVAAEVTILHVVMLTGSAAEDQLPLAVLADRALALVGAPAESLLTAARGGEVNESCIVVVGNAEPAVTGGGQTHSPFTGSKLQMGI